MKDHFEIIDKNRNYPEILWGNHIIFLNVNENYDFSKGKKWNIYMKTKFLFLYIKMWSKLSNILYDNVIKIIIK